jgi:anti-anti-sigma regulatory factor
MASTTTSTASSGGDPTSILGSTLGPLDQVNHTASLRIRGSLCAITAGEHARQLGELVDQGYTDVRVDLEGLLLCTSHGLDLWDDVQHRLDPLDGRLILAGASGVVRRVLQVVAESRMHFCPTVVPAA